MFKMTEKVSIVTDLDLRDYPFEAWPDDAKQLAYQALSRPHNLARIQMITGHEERRKAIIQLVGTEQVHQMRFRKALLGWLGK